MAAGETPFLRAHRPGSRRRGCRSTSTGSLAGIVGGPVYYLPPKDSSPRIAIDDLLQQANIRIVNSGRDLFSLAPNDLSAVIIEKSRWDEVDHDWLIKEKLSGNVIVGARINERDLVPMLDAAAAERPWTDYTPDRNFFSLYAECPRGNGGSRGEASNHLDVHPESDFRFMLALIANHARNSNDCPSPSATPAGSDVSNPLLQASWMPDANDGWVAGTSRSGCQEDSAGCTGLIFHTADGGNTWEHQYSGEVQVTAIASNSEQFAMAIGPTGVCNTGNCPSAVLRTNDGGSHWDQVMATPLKLSQIAISGGDAWVLAQGCTQQSGSGCGWQIFDSSDGGDTWRFRPNAGDPAWPSP